MVAPLGQTRCESNPEILNLVWDVAITVAMAARCYMLSTSCCYVRLNTNSC